MEEIQPAGGGQHSADSQNNLEGCPPAVGLAHSDSGLVAWVTGTPQLFPPSGAATKARASTRSCWDKRGPAGPSVPSFGPTPKRWAVEQRLWAAHSWVTARASSQAGRSPPRGGLPSRGHSPCSPAPVGPHFTWSPAPRTPHLTAGPCTPALSILPPLCTAGLGVDPPAPDRSCHTNRERATQTYRAGHFGSTSFSWNVASATSPLGPAERPECRPQCSHLGTPAPPGLQTHFLAGELKVWSIPASNNKIPSPSSHPRSGHLCVCGFRNPHGEDT